MKYQLGENHKKNCRGIPSDYRIHKFSFELSHSWTRKIKIQSFYMQYLRTTSTAVGQWNTLLYRQTSLLSEPTTISRIDVQGSS